MIGNKFVGYNKQLTSELFKYNQSAEVLLSWKSNAHPRLDRIKTLWHSPRLVRRFIYHPLAAFGARVCITPCLTKVQKKLA